MINMETKVPAIVEHIHFSKGRQQQEGKSGHDEFTLWSVL